MMNTRKAAIRSTSCGAVDRIGNGTFRIEGFNGLFGLGGGLDSSPTSSATSSAAAAQQQLFAGIVLIQEDERAGIRAEV